MSFLVYEVWEDGKDHPFYVGKTRYAVEERHIQHLKSMKKNCRTAFHKKLRSLIEKNMAYEFRTIFRSDFEYQVLAEERRLIAHHGRRDLGKGPLLNLTDGGEGVSGRIYSPETRTKMSNSQKGLKKGPSPFKGCKRETPRNGPSSWTEKQKQCFKNRTPEQIELKRIRASASHKGKSISEEVRKAHSLRMTGEGNPNFGKVGYYSGKVGPNKGRPSSRKGKKRGLDGKYYLPHEIPSGDAI